ncbi:hypothetical protein [Mesorhizobium sp. A623]
MLTKHCIAMAILSISLSLGCFGGVSAEGLAPGTPAVLKPATPAALEATDVPGIGSLGKWMIDPDGVAAQWGGETFEGKTLREPINVVFIDARANDAADAKVRLIEAMTRAGYPSRFHHSSGYRGVIDGQVYGQLPEQDGHAFSTHLYIFDNNHARVFGPRQTDAGWVFIAALSHENVDYQKREHVYSSFARARDELAAALTEKTAYQLAESVPLGNGSGADFTTGDHDGNAIVLRAP